MAERKNNQRPGQPRNPYGSPASKNRLAWVRLEGIELVIYDATDGEENTEPGEDLTIMFAKAGRRPFAFRPTSWTEAELDAAEALILEGFRRARETVQLRDKTAEEAYAQGAVPFKRLYRRPPVVVGRPGEEFQYGQELFGRSTDVPGVVLAGRTVGPIGVPSPGVAEQESARSSTQDDPATPDEPEVIRILGDAFDIEGLSGGLQVSDSSENDSAPDPGGTGRSLSDAGDSGVRRDEILARADSDEWPADQ